MSDRASEIQSFIITELVKLARTKGKTVSEFTDDVELFETGILDSLGFIKLVTDVEREFDLEVDFSEHDPESFSTLGGLVAIVQGEPKAT